MDYTSYYKARDIIQEILRKDLLGPVRNDEIICEERPLEYYILGKLYPQDTVVGEVVKSSSEDCGELDDEASTSLSNEKNPSSFGLSFSISSESKFIKVIPQAAKYNLVEMSKAQHVLQFDKNKYRKTTHFWEREQLNINEITVDLNLLKNKKAIRYRIGDNLYIHILLHRTYPDNTKTITITMINENIAEGDFINDCKKSYFQPEIRVVAENNVFIDVRRNINLTKNDEIMELEMLYSGVGDYASGHGCAVSWEVNEEESVTEIKTDFFPEYELKQMMPTANFKSRVLEMKYLSESGSSEVIEGLQELTRMYSEWIKYTENKSYKLDPSYSNVAKRNINKCKLTLNVLNKSIEELRNPNVFKAFSLANTAMFMQRKQMLKNMGKFENDKKIKWYPFQLAFFLQEIYSFSRPESEDRKKVDLLWFPTGGGKTEAYLGIAAFVIFLRRLRNDNNGEGVTILMRYTLRLLSFQQFERATALICACEILRKQNKVKGGEIGIGLWAGQSLTPNRIDRADKILRGEKDKYLEESNPVQLEKCPWCGAILSAENYSCNIEEKRMLIKCSNEKCDFTGGLPVYLIDEEIYKYSPTFIVATVDKFAQLALNSDTSSLFGIGIGKLPPELIIQDELHLISGPLGTITGLYESAIKKLCEHNGCPAKVIASTATIRNAEEQIRSLFASDYTQFPPQGIDINDSFFAEISKKEDRPARLYIGCMAIGTSSTTMLVRVMASFLYASRYLVESGFDEKVIDSFWTITGYFNSLRELGGAIIRVVDDIQDRYMYLKSNKFSTLYPLVDAASRYDRYKELTSREKSENIGKIIQNELKEPYTSNGSTSPYDFLLSSNMISVGVDVARLGSMVVFGQPKTTSEYIQATSRVGRETPGLVLTTYNQAKSRDRSHYEDFTQYHSNFYKFVESTSVTPFSNRARDRALQAIYVILCRNLISSLKEDYQAVNYRRNLEELQEIRDYIMSYVEFVDPGEYEYVKYDIDEIERIWEQKSIRREKLLYRKSKYNNQNDVLFEPDYNESSRFRVLNSMRNIETMIKVVINDSKKE